MAESNIRDARRVPSPPTPRPLRWARGESSRDVVPIGTDHDVNTPLAQCDGRGASGEGKPRTSTTFDAAAYAARIGYRGDLTPTVETLRALHLAHLRAVPFENLDIHFGRPIVLDEELLFDKIVRRRRGGFCYELNGLFAALLREIGFEVTLLAAQYPRGEGQIGPEFDHLTLLVGAEDAGRPLLTDVGSGRGSALPLRTDTTDEQAQPIAEASFRLLPEGDGARLWRREPDGEWERQYAFSWIPRQLGDFTEGCLFHQTSPNSHFTEKRICTLMTPTGRVTLSERRLITTVDGVRGEQELDDAAYRQTLWTLFGIDLDA